MTHTALCHNELHFHSPLEKGQDKSTRQGGSHMRDKFLVELVLTFAIFPLEGQMRPSIRNVVPTKYYTQPHGRKKVGPRSFLLVILLQLCWNMDLASLSQHPRLQQSGKKPEEAAKTNAQCSGTGSERGPQA